MQSTPFVSPGQLEGIVPEVAVWGLMAKAAVARKRTMGIAREVFMNFMVSRGFT